MQSGTLHWLHGLGSAFIGGGAGAVTAGFTAAVIDPKAFNTGTQLKPLLALMGVTFLVNGLLSVFFYLKQSPLPPDDPATKV